MMDVCDCDYMKELYDHFCDCVICKYCRKYYDELSNMDHFLTKKAKEVIVSRGMREYFVNMMKNEGCY